jgi:hypothetical protein
MWGHLPLRTREEIWGQVLHYDNCAVHFALWLGPCEQNFLLRCSMSPPIAIDMLLIGSEYEFSGLRHWLLFQRR